MDIRGLRGTTPCRKRLRFHIEDFSFCLYTLPSIHQNPRPMSSLPTADLLALDTPGLKSRLSKLRRYL